MGCIRKWQRAKENRVNERENGSVGADAESERQYGDRSESGRLAQHADGKAQILREVFEPGPAPRIVAGFAQREKVAEMFACGGVRVSFREAILDLLFFAQFEMHAHF